jgi:hypothetical protein
VNKDAFELFLSSEWSKKVVTNAEAVTGQWAWGKTFFLATLFTFVRKATNIRFIFVLPFQHQPSL